MHRIFWIESSKILGDLSLCYQSTFDPCLTAIWTLILFWSNEITSGKKIPVIAMAALRHKIYWVIGENFLGFLDRHQNRDRGKRKGPFTELYHRNTYNFQIQLVFSDPFKLQRPNECDANFVDIFKERTDMSSREKNFCGSIADTVLIGANTAFVRFYAEPKALNSSFEAVMTALRDRDPGDKREFTNILD